MKKIFLSLCLLAAAGMMYAQTEYYVSVDGKDSNAGTERNRSLRSRRLWRKPERSREKWWCLCVKVCIGWMRQL